MLVDDFPVLFVPGPMPNMNDILGARLNIFIPPGIIKVGNGLNVGRLPNEYSKLKKRWHGIITEQCKKQSFPKLTDGGYMNFLILEANKRRDPDNVGSGAQKIIQDALKEAGFLENDGWKQIRGYRHFFDVDAGNPGCYLIVTKERCLNEEEASDFFYAVQMRAGKVSD